MPKRLLRFIALLLIPCLLADPALAVQTYANAVQTMTPVHFQMALFTRQALAPEAVQELDELLGPEPRAGMVREASHLMPNPILRDPTDSKSPLQKLEKGPAKARIILKFNPASGRTQGWSVVDRKDVSSQEADEIATLLAQGALAHLRMKGEAHPVKALRSILSAHPDVIVEFRRNSFEEQVFFETPPSGTPVVRIVLDPSLRTIEKKTNRHGGLYEAAGWIVQGEQVSQKVVTARTWMALLEEISPDAFVKAYGHLPVFSSFEKERRTVRLRDLFRWAVTSSVSHLTHPELLATFHEWVGFVLEEIDARWPGARDGKHLMPVPVVPPSDPVPMARDPILGTVYNASDLGALSTPAQRSAYARQLAEFEAREFPTDDPDMLTKGRRHYLAALKKPSPRDRLYVLLARHGKIRGFAHTTEYLANGTAHVELLAAQNEGVSGRGTLLMEALMSRWAPLGLKVYIRSASTAIRFYHRFLTGRVDYSSTGDVNFHVFTQTYQRLTGAQKKEQLKNQYRFVTRRQEVEAALRQAPAGSYEMAKADAPFFRIVHSLRGEWSLPRLTDRLVYLRDMGLRKEGAKQWTIPPSEIPDVPRVESPNHTLHTTLTYQSQRAPVRTLSVMQRINQQEADEHIADFFFFDRDMMRILQSYRVTPYVGLSRVAQLIPEKKEIRMDVIALGHPVMAAVVHVHEMAEALFWEELGPPANAEERRRRDIMATDIELRFLITCYPARDVIGFIGYLRDHPELHQEAYVELIIRFVEMQNPSYRKEYDEIRSYVLVGDMIRHVSHREKQVSSAVEFPVLPLPMEQIYIVSDTLFSLIAQEQRDIGFFSVPAPEDPRDITEDIDIMLAREALLVARDEQLAGADRLLQLIDEGDAIFVRASAADKVTDEDINSRFWNLRLELALTRWRAESPDAYRVLMQSLYKNQALAAKHAVTEFSEEEEKEILDFLNSDPWEWLTTPAHNEDVPIVLELFPKDIADKLNLLLEKTKPDHQTIQDVRLEATEVPIQIEGSPDYFDVIKPKLEGRYAKVITDVLNRRMEKLPSRAMHLRLEFAKAMIIVEVANRLDSRVWESQARAEIRKLNILSNTYTYRPVLGKYFADGLTLNVFLPLTLLIAVLIDPRMQLGLTGTWVQPVSWPGWGWLAGAAVGVFLGVPILMARINNMPGRTGKSWKKIKSKDREKVWRHQDRVVDRKKYAGKSYDELYGKNQPVPPTPPAAPASEAVVPPLVTRLTIVPAVATTSTPRVVTPITPSAVVSSLWGQALRVAAFTVGAFLIMTGIAYGSPRANAPFGKVLRIAA